MLDPGHEGHGRSPCLAREATAAGEAGVEPKATGAHGLGWGRGAPGGASKASLPGEKTGRVVGISLMRGEEAEGQSGKGTAPGTKRRL